MTVVVQHLIEKLRAELKAEIAEVRNLDRDRVAGRIAELVHAFAQEKFKQLDERVAKIEARLVPWDNRL
jgi:hypothetical protein